MNHKKWYIIVIIISLFAFNSINLVAKADSGWDTSYDSGTSWDSGGTSWDSSDSWSSDNYSSGSYGDGSISATTILVVFIVIFIVIIIASRSQKSGSNYISSNTYNDLPDEKLASYDINKEEFKEMVYNKYILIQNAWSSFDYDKLRMLLTDELYNSYIMQLDALKLKNQKNIMKDFKLIDCKIIDLKEENGLLNIITYLRIQMYDYVVDKDNKTVRGNSSHKIDIEYLITFVKSNQKTSDIYCPNCGAEVKVSASGKCNYCGAVIVVNAKDYVMSKKTCIGQRSK